MRAGRQAACRGFEMKAIYSVPELAALIGMHHRTLRRWLARKDVPLLRVGASVAVPLVALPRGVSGGMGVVESGERVGGDRALPCLR